MKEKSCTIFLVTFAVSLARDCKVDEAGYDYQGTISVTREGIACQAWSAQDPHSHSYDEDYMFVDGSVATAGSFCRNPDDDESGGPWCYTVESGTRWNHCDIPICTDEVGKQQFEIKVTHVRKCEIYIFPGSQAFFNIQ